MNTIDESAESSGWSEIRSIIRYEARWFAAAVLRGAVVALIVVTALTILRFWPGHVIALASGIITGAVLILSKDSIVNAWHSFLRWMTTTKP